jgi:hypothetical protein
LVGTCEKNREPWRSDRWSDYAKETVIKYWTKLLKDSASDLEAYPSLHMLDLSRLSLSIPHPIWTAAGTNPVNIKKTTVVSWLLLNVYKTGERLFKMKIVKTTECVTCQDLLDDQIHFALQCPSLFSIRS